MEWVAESIIVLNNGCITLRHNRNHYNHRRRKPDYSFAKNLVMRSKQTVSAHSCVFGYFYLWLDTLGYIMYAASNVPEVFEVNRNCKLYPASQKNLLWEADKSNLWFLLFVYASLPVLFSYLILWAIFCMQYSKTQYISNQSKL